MALVSPGLEITVTDESQYVPGAVGTVPLIIMATAQDKTNPSGGSATDTTAARAGKLLTFSSQRELIASMGYPIFQQSASGTPLHGDERNEYGLMTAYSVLGNVNRIYAIRADIDLDQLVGTSVRPAGNVANGTHWMDLSESVWGINEWDAVTGQFTLKTPILITSTANQTLTSGVYVPNDEIGQVGSYAVSFGTGSNAILFYKARDNLWKRLGTDAWATSLPLPPTCRSTPHFAVKASIFTTHESLPPPFKACSAGTPSTASAVASSTTPATARSYQRRVTWRRLSSNR